MRSSRSAPDRAARATDPIDPGRAGFAHRGLHGPDIRENSLMAVERAIAIGAGIEIDVLLSSDGVPVGLHDFEVGRFGPSEFGDPRNVAAMTAVELGNARLGDGLPIASPLTELLALVAGRVPLLIEAKVDSYGRSRARLIAAAIARTVADYRGTFAVMSFHPLVPHWLKRDAPAIRRGLVIADALSGWRRALAIALASPQFFAIEVAALGKPWVARLRRGAPVYSWTVRSDADRETAAVHADAAIWEDDGRP